MSISILRQPCHWIAQKKKNSTSWSLSSYYNWHNVKIIKVNRGRKKKKIQLEIKYVNIDRATENKQLKSRNLFFFLDNSYYNGMCIIGVSVFSSSFLSFLSPTVSIIMAFRISTLQALRISTVLLWRFALVLYTMRWKTNRKNLFKWTERVII